MTEEVVVEERDLAVDGLPAKRILTQYEPFGNRLHYIIGIDGSMPSETSDVRYIWIMTRYGDPTFARDSEAVDEIAGGFMVGR